MYRVAINGFGRIGRNVLRACYEKNFPIQIVAINDLGSPEINAHLLQFDSTHGEFKESVSLESGADNKMLVKNNTILMLSEPNPEKLPWKALGIDIVLECTGRFTNRQAANEHIKAGAGSVLVSAPGTDMDATIVYGVNHTGLSAEHQIISNASCTTNCLAPVADVLHKEFGIISGLANTVHAYTNDQSLTDNQHSDLRRARAAARSMIPSKTGAAAAIGQVIPELDGKLDGLAVRVPVLNVSLLDLTVMVKENVSIDKVNSALQASVSGYSGVMQVNHLPLVSSDFNHNAASSIVDITQTRVQGQLVKVLAWYDNEWGFSNRMLNTASYLCEQRQASMKYVS